MDYELINQYRLHKNNSNKKTKNQLIVKTVNKLLLSIIFLLGSIILIKNSSQVREFYQSKIFNESLNFAKFNSLYNKYFGSMVKDFQVPDTTTVFKENITYSKIEDYLNGSMLSVTPNYMVPVIESGIIVYLGDKDALKNTCIVQGIDGVDIWYSNIDISNLTLMDYVSKGDLLSQTISDKLYLTLQKDNNYIKYEDYAS